MLSKHVFCYAGQNCFFYSNSFFEKTANFERGKEGNFKKAMELLYDIVLYPGSGNGFSESIVSVEKKNIMSVPVPKFNVSYRIAERSNAQSYGFAFTSGDLDEAVSIYYMPPHIP